ncbi:MAG: hypothetical protein ACKVI1_09650 [Flavobacteriales bacterium]
MSFHASCVLKNLRASSLVFGLWSLVFGLWSWVSVVGVCLL